MKKTIIAIMLSCCGLAAAQGTNTVLLTIPAETLVQRVNNITNLQLQVSNAVSAVSNAVIEIDNKIIDVDQSVLDMQLAVSNSMTNAAAQLNLIASQVANLGFTNAVVSSGFTNANFSSIDLSPYVGTNKALVLMRFQAVSASTVSVRVPGDTNTVDDTSMNSVAIAAGSSAYMICDTSTNGVVEVKATANTSMNLIAFIRRHVFE